MEYRTLGKDLTVSAVGLGCMGMSHAYGAPADKREMSNLLAEAVDMGYTFFDTAEVYGTPENPHDNEELVGMALKPYRNRILLATKFGIHFDMESSEVNKPLLPDSRPEVIRTSLEDSLKRLNTDHIDLYYQHRPDPDVPIEEVAGVMAELNIGFVAFSPLANGFLSGKYGKDASFEAGTDYRSVMPQFTKEGIDRNQNLLGLLNRMAKEKLATPAQISMAWMLCKKPYIVPIPGTRKTERLGENAGAADVKLTVWEVKALDDALDTIKMSEVFGGTRVVVKEKKMEGKRE